MNFSYILLAITCVSCFLFKDKKFFWSLVFLTHSAALYEGLVQPVGIFFIIIFSLLCHFYFLKKKRIAFLNRILLSTILLFTAGFCSHVISGFSNTLVLDRVSLSPLSAPFSMTLNFDKVIAALIIYMTSHLYASEKRIDMQSIQQVFLYLTLCICVVLIPGYGSGYITIDPKIPSIFWIWVCNNLLFVCAGEEIIFRGFVQNTLKSWLAPYHWARYLHVIIASMIFGLFHLSGGWIYVALASLCGLFYGYTYEKTSRIFCSVIVHFGLNFVHLIFFTYPFTYPLSLVLHVK